MSKMIQIRDVPDAVHSTLKARAAQEGMSLSDYIKRELERSAQLATMREWLQRTERLKPIRGGKSATEVLRELRDAQ